MEDFKKDYILYLADNVMILGQRLGELCGHGPVLEQDIAMTNISLDLIGEARNYYQYLAEIDSGHEDDYPMKRDVRSFKNVILVERPNGHWGDTIMRQFMFDCFHYYLLEGLTTSSDQRLSSIAKKSIKEASYHLSFSSEWAIRLGDGTDESHQKMQESLNDAMPYFEEMFLPADFELKCQSLGIAPDLSVIRKAAYHKFEETIHTATLKLPENKSFQKGGKTGLHSEHLGYILAELQFMQRAYPNATW